jgi:hypothetical protein
VHALPGLTSAILSDFPLAVPVPGLYVGRVLNAAPPPHPVAILRQPGRLVDNLKAAWLSWPISFRFDRRQQIGLNALSDAPAFAYCSRKNLESTTEPD